MKRLKQHHDTMKTTISNLIRNYSFNQVESMYYQGRIGRLTFEAYGRVWDWITFRMGGTASWKQDCLWKKSKSAVYAKINKTRTAFGFEPYAMPVS
jgi:hypothetical protein